jgi:hypothetical protein
MNNGSLVPRSILIAITAATASLLAPLTGSAQKPAVVYQWDAAAWLANYNRSQFSALPVANPDGSTGAQITVTPRDAGNPYNHIVVTAGGMKGGDQYTAAITFSVLEPTEYPTSFYMFARNSAGNQYDIWQTWIGLPGATRTVTLPMDLKPVVSGTWKLFMGISKSGALNINRIVIYSGLTSDGTTSYATAGAPPNQTPSTPPPDGVTEATGCAPFTIAPPAPSKLTVSLADYKLAADTAGAPPSVAVDNASALQKAFTDCKGKGPMTLVIPKGTYRLAPVSNLTIDGLTDVTIDGRGSVLILEKFTKEGPAFLVGHCVRTLLKDFTIDWDWNVKPIASLGTVSNLSADKLQCDFTFPDLDAARTAITRATPWRSIFAMDPTHLIRTDTNIFPFPKGAVITAGTAGNVLHVAFPKPVPFVNGQAYCIRHLYYDMSGFKILDSSDLTFDAVDIYSIPGMGWFFEGAMHNFQVSNCKICRAPGSRNPLTTAADGLHVDQFVDNLNVENCDFTGSGDDAMNIHNESYEGDIVTDGTDASKLTLMNCPSYQLRLNPGDPLEFYNADYSYLGGSTSPVTRRVASVSSNNKGKPQTIIHLAAKLPAGITAQSILINGRFATSNVRIANCNVEYSNGRGILLSAHNALITDCKLRSVYCTAINLESEIVTPLWTEGRGASNLLVKNNTFEDDNRMGRYNGAVIYTDAHFPWGPSTAAIYKQISIENNRFFNCPGPALSLSNCSNVLVRSNEIHVTHPVANPARYAGMFFVKNSSDLALGGNQWISGTSDPFTGGIVYDPATISNLSPNPAANIDRH